MFKISKEKIDKILKYSCPALAFLIPVIIVLLLLNNNNFAPFDQEGNTLLTIDLQGQYIAFFRYFKAVLHGDYNLIYTLSKTYGGDMQSIYSYYLSSPLNFLLVFFSYQDIPLFILIITIIKLTLASFNAYICFITLTKNKLIALLFALSYALISYNFAYLSNIMWLDGVMILPLVVLGINKIVKGESALIYILTLGYCIFTSWYIGFMICLFSCLWFLYQVVINKKLVFKLLSLPVTIFLLSSLAAGFLSSFSWYLALHNIAGTKGDNSSIFNAFFNNISNYYDSFFNIGKSLSLTSFNNKEAITANGMHIYVGAISLYFGALFFFNQAFSKKERIASLILVSIFIFSFINVGFNLLWHGGASPTWFAYRYAFIFCFVIIYLALRSLDNIKAVKLIYLPVPILLYFMLLQASSLYYQNQLSDEQILSQLYNFSLNPLVLLFLSTIIIATLIIKYNKKAVIDYVTISLLIIINSANLFINNDHVIKQMATNFSFLANNIYQEDEKIQTAVDLVKRSDDTLYRLEKTFQRQGSYNQANNDPMYYQYNGLSHYSSNEKKAVMYYHQQLGFHHNGFWENYKTGNTIAINSYLGVKYILDRPNSNKEAYYPADYLTLFDLQDDIRISLNDYHLPLGFLVKNSESTYISEGEYLLDNSIYWYDHFQYQNQIFKSIVDVVDEFGVAKDIFKKATYTKTLSNGISAVGENIYTSIAPNATITYNIVDDHDYPYYYSFKDYYNASLMVNGGYQDYFSYWSYQINPYSFPAFSNPNIKITLKEQITNKEIREAIYYEDLAVLAEYISAIKNDNCQVKAQSTTRYVIDVDVSAERQTLLLTLPYEADFNIYVNNKKLTSLKRFNIFLAARLPLGKQQVTIVYAPPRINAAFMTISAIATICLYSLYRHQIENKLQLILDKLEDKIKS